MTRKSSSIPPSPGDNGPLYTIDELSAKTGVPSRTIRFYQGKGAIKPPEKRGRVAYYNDEHIERLELVAQLQDRGLNLRAIAELVSHIDGNVSVREWLGLGEKLQAAWTNDAPTLYSEDELREILGSAYRPGMIVELEKLEIIRREGAMRPARFLVESTGLLKICMKLYESGFALDLNKTVADIMHKHLGKMVDEMSTLYLRYLTKDLPIEEMKNLDPVQIGHSVQALREIWIEATQLILAQEIERSTQEMVEKGKMLTGKRGRRGRK